MMMMIRAFFVMVRAGTAYREMKMRNVYFVGLLLWYRIINHGILGPSRNFSRETVRMYKNPGDQEIFQKDWVQKNFLTKMTKTVIEVFRVEISLYNGLDGE